MHFREFRLSLTLAFVGLVASVGSSAPPAWGQAQGTAATSNTKDPAAVAALTQMETTLGWTSVYSPSDLIATGTLTIYAGKDSANFAATYKIKGGSEFLTDLSDDQGTMRTVSNGKAAGVLKPDGTVDHLLPSFYPRSMRPMAFPFLTYLASAVGAPEVSIQNAGTRVIGGVSCQGIAIARNLDAKDPLAPVEKLGSPMTIWIAKTGLPTEIDYALLAMDNFRAVMHRVRTFADYRAINGVAVPFHQEEFVDGQNISKLDLTNVQFNSGLSDAEFNVPAAQGGQQ